MNLSLSPQLAWDPLPPAEWNAEAARHLLRRAGWTAQPAAVERAVREGLSATLDRLFPVTPVRLAQPRQSAAVADEMLADAEKIRRAAPEEKRLLQREEREKSRAALLDLTLRWLDYAAEADNSAFAKWTLFLSDIYVVSFEKVARTPLLYQHFDLLARYGLGPAPALTKAVSRSPAMIVYLDLNQNRRGAPNENFARELLELFVLGEGNYSEADIKEAARAFTGYRLRPPGREFFFAANQHDNGRKTVFGHSGAFTGDEVIDLAYQQPAAAAFLPHEWVKFYLADTMLPKPYLAAIGALWSAQGLDLRWIARRLFGSRLFFAPEFRGEFIKSPVQFYLGLMQDLDLNVLPVPRFVINPLRQMGQVLFVPPNVRGWVGGRSWINSASLAARRSLVEMLFAPLNEAALNNDELVDIVAARTAGPATFTVADERLAPLGSLAPATAAHRLATTLLPTPPGPVFEQTLADYLGSAPRPEYLRRAKRALISVLQSPDYQLS
jgi:uncharacterized protein (DUF1800 family)